MNYELKIQGTSKIEEGLYESQPVASAPGICPTLSYIGSTELQGHPTLFCLALPFRVKVALLTKPKRLILNATVAAPEPE